jgi:hypothetical protein
VNSNLPSLSNIFGNTFKKSPPTAQDMGAIPDTDMSSPVGYKSPSMVASGSTSDHTTLNRGGLTGPYSGGLTGISTGQHNIAIGHAAGTTMGSQTSFHLTEDMTIHIDDYKITGSELKLMLPLMKKLLMQEFPEEFV